MPTTPLHDQIVAAGARLSDYLGAETAATFGDPRREYVELRSGCGIYDLGWRAKIVGTGADRVRWMNGMVTNNIRDLPPGHGNYNFLLNAQGRILGDMYIYNRGDYLLLDTARWQALTLLEVMNKYIIMDDVELTDITEKLTALAVQGPRAPEVLRDAGFNFADVEPLQVQDIAWNDLGLSITRMAGDISHSYEIWLAPAGAAAVWDALARSGAKPVGTDALEMFRLAAGIPRYGLDITERYLPQEAGQDQALNFKKGCYLGQEIVERIHSRALLHRMLTGFVVDGPPPAPGAKIQRGGKDVGEITSALTVPGGNGDRTLALGYLRMEARSPGAELSINGARAVVRLLPYKELAA
ncbi:MAG: aminomethyltransferase family protein [Acidobacteriia bacterium]|nr:aminomethyltransferase family protein [Terriglobia bacterium]